MKRKEFLFHSSRAIGFYFINTDYLSNVQNEEKDETEKLFNYLKTIKDDFYKNKPVVENNNLFKDFKNLNKEQRVEDFDIYFPLYKSGEIKYKVPWLMLWIIHIHETTVSREPNPEINGYMGAMQRNPIYYNKDYVKDAASDWEFLKYLPQRYTTDKYFKTNDYEEILFAAKKTRSDADQRRSLNNNLDFETSIMQAQYNYCSKYFADQRIEKFKEIKPLFMF